MKKYNSIATVLLFMALLFSLSLFAWFKAPGRYSETERRTLAQLPKLSIGELSTGMYMSKFDSYSMDQFPMREGFRSVKALSLKYLFAQKDNKGLYSVNGYLSKLEYPLNDTRLEQSISKINAVIEQYIKGTDCRVYLSLIPDKNCFLAPMGRYPHIDFIDFEAKLLDELPHDAYINIYDLLSVEDFYFTDQHWRQECIRDVANRLLNAMTGEGAKSEYIELSLEREFYGAYAGQSALPAKPDTIRYLTNKVLETCTVYDYSTGKALPAAVYSFEKAEGRDPYELFLNGSTPLIVIENPNAESGRELVIFRDSFGSSLAPLLVENYSKITLVDLRYIRSELLGNYISFDNQDVLFIYSTLILNNVISM